MPSSTVEPLNTSPSLHAYFVVGFIYPVIMTFLMWENGDACVCVYTKEPLKKKPTKFVEFFMYTA